ncbi:MAG: TatD family hydrolase [Bacteroidota bacterium]
MLVDTHVHLYLDAFEADRDAVVARAHAAGVTTLLQPAVDVASIGTALSLCDRYDGVWAMAGIHPTYLQDADPMALEAVEAALEDPKVLAVGETGLDYYWNDDHVSAQKDSLAAHALLAIRHGLPLVLHNRDKKGSERSSKDLVDVLTHVRDTHTGGDALTGVFHCFGGPVWLAQEVLDLGFCVGIGGTVTFKNGGVPSAIADVPLDRIVLETDGPYLAPVPHRGTRNEPSYVPLVASRLAEIYSVSMSTVTDTTTETARRLFRWPQSKSEHDMK